MIRLIKPYISFPEVEKEFREVFESGWFTKGKNVDLFVQEIKKYTKADYAFLTTSATTALSTCLKILGIGYGDEVIVSDFSFPATANVVQDVGAKPIFADVDIHTFNMLTEELTKKITDRTKAVIFVDALGNPSGIHNIKQICSEKNIPLIEDAACAIGSGEYDRKCGNIADLTCFSFHPRKLLTTGEGGAITTNNEKYSELLSVKLNHGSIVKDNKFHFIDYGYNFRMSELQCVMGIKQIRKIDNIVDERNEIRDRFVDRLSAVDMIPQKIDHSVRYNVQSLVFKVPDSIDRDDLIRHLYTRNIETTIGTYSLSNLEYYRKKYKDQIQENSFRLQNTTLTLPCYQGVDCDLIIDEIIDYADR